MTDRAPLRSIIITATGQDVCKCKACEYCYIDDALEAKFDMPVWDVMAAARRNDEAALTNQTIWVLQDASPDSLHCPNDFDFLAIAAILRQESRRRGLAQNVVEYK
jgi:hypothetical protein